MCFCLVREGVRNEDALLLRGKSDFALSEAGYFRMGKRKNRTKFEGVFKKL